LSAIESDFRVLVVAKPRRFLMARSRIIGFAFSQEKTGISPLFSGGGGGSEGEGEGEGGEPDRTARPVV